MYRNNLPQLQNIEFITDGGLETVFVFQKAIDLPLFAAFDLLNSNAGVAALRDYYLPYIELAKQYRTGLILDTATWRASHGWGAQLGYSKDQMRDYNQQSIDILSTLRERHANGVCPMVLNGAIGPHDDGYNPGEILDAQAAEAYHSHQVQAFADSEADMVTAVTMTYADEAVGIARAAEKAGIPAAIGFTVETDGRLPDGSTLQQAIEKVDCLTERSPAYYMINCAHPSHFAHVLEQPGDWTDRIYAVRANASCKSHAELDCATELDAGNPIEFGEWYAALARRLKNLSIVGGCCGTDHRHVGEVCHSFLPVRRSAILGRTGTH